MKKTKEKSKEKYGVPALMSFIIPGVGQIIKGDIKWGIAIWFWLIFGGGLSGYLLKLIFGTVFGFILTVLLIIAFWLYQVYDAYNEPALN